MSKAPATTSSISPPALAATAVGEDSRTAVLQHATGELIFAVVGHVGSGTSTVAESLRLLLSSKSSVGGYDVIPLKARDVIDAWARATKHTVPSPGQHDLGAVQTFQDLGDEMRLATKDHAAVARRLIAQIRLSRASKTGVSGMTDGPIRPDGKKRAYILESTGRGRHHIVATPDSRTVSWSG